MPPKDESRGAKELSKTSTKKRSPRKRKRFPPPPPPVQTSNRSVEAPGSSSRVSSPKGLKQYSFLRANSGINWQGVNRTLLERLNQLGRQTGNIITLTSGFRTHTEQRRLYEAYLRGEIGLAAPPGQSNHEHGNAVDAVVNGQAIADAIPENVLNSLGLSSLAHLGDSVHVELSSGGGSGAAPSSPAAQQLMAPTEGGYVAPVESGQYTPPSYAPTPTAPETAELLPFEVQDDQMQGLMNAQQRAETWQLIGEQPGASPETQTLARIARLAGGI